MFEKGGMSVSPPASFPRRAVQMSIKYGVGAMKGTALALVPTCLRNKLEHRRGGTQQQAASKTPNPGPLTLAVAPAAKAAPSSRLGDTAWMDGCRGLLSILILTVHQLHAYEACPHIFFRAARVAFFVIGGYVSSYNAQDLMTKGNVPAAVSGISKSSFRKCLRLWLPTFATVFFIGFLSWAGAYDSLRPWLNGFGNPTTYFTGMWPPFITPKKKTLLEQMGFAWRECLNFINVWQFERYGYGKEAHPAPEHNAFLWTFRHEFRASLTLYLCLILTAYVAPLVRFFALVALSELFLYAGRWEITIFFWGAAVAQLDILYLKPFRTRNQEPPCTPGSDPTVPLLSSLDDSTSDLESGTTRFRDRYLQIGVLVVRVLAWTVLLPAAVLLVSYPFELKNHHPYIYHLADEFTPHRYKVDISVLQAAGWALMIIFVHTLSAQSPFRRLFTNSFARYFGKQYFGMITTHWIVLCAGGYWLPYYFWNFLGTSGWKASGMEFFVGWFMGWVVNFVLSVWAADIWTREVLARTNKLSAWIESKIFMAPAQAAAKSASVSPSRMPEK